MKKIIKVWTFASDSNPDKEYETLKYADGSTSCNCMGWTRRVASDGSRSYKHTRYVDMGVADSHASATHNYQQQQQQQPKHSNHNAKNQQHQVIEMPKLGYRKFAV